MRVSLVLLGIALRIGAARGQLWLDEIWSCEVARDMRGLGAIFSTIHDDNNHYLNTAWLMLVGDPSPLVARGLALLSGIGTLVLVARNGLRARGARARWPRSATEGANAGRNGGADVGTRRPALERLTAVTLFATSYILVHYDSEARGYAPLVFFSVACYFALDALLAEARWKHAWLFAASAIGGWLSHLTFLFPFAGFVAWAATDRVRRGIHPAGPSRAATAPSPPNAGTPVKSRKLLVAFVPPILTLLLLWLVDIQHMIVRGGPQFELLAVLRELLSATLGLPGGPLQALSIFVLGAAAATGFVLLRSGDSRWVFFLTTLLLAPGFLLWLRPPEYLAPRYFLACVPFLLLLLGTALSWLAHGPDHVRSRPLVDPVDSGRTDRLEAPRGIIGSAPGRQTAFAVVLALFVLGSSFPIARLLREGRGHYREAVAFLSEETAGSEVTFTSDHEFRNGIVVAYYLPSAGRGKSFDYVDEDAPGEPPEWYLKHDFALPPAPEPSITSVRGERFVLAQTFPYAGLSGWNWYLYRRAIRR